MSFPRMIFDATILYDTPIKLPLVAAFHAALNQRLGRAGNSVAMAKAQAETYFTFHSDSLYIEVTFSRTKLPLDGFKAALQAGVNQMRNEKFAHYIDDHIETISVSVGDGRVPMPPDFREMLQSSGFPREHIDKAAGGSNGVDPRIKIAVLHSALETVLETIMPTATVVHWRDTDLLYTAMDFPPITPALPFPVTLTSQPQIFNTGLTPDGQQTHGIIMRRSELLCGRTLFADTTTYDAQTIITAMQLIMLSHIIGGRQLEDGATGSFDEHTAFRLEFRPPNQTTPAGGIAMLIGPAAPLAARKPDESKAKGEARKGWWPFGKKRTLH
jgi:hypothetical protein